MTKPKSRPKPNHPRMGGSQGQKAVEEAAYFRWLARNREHGKDLDDWLYAEQEMMENIFEHDVEG
jgi:hypothetical protein